MNTKPEQYLLPVRDDLPLRRAEPHSLYKFVALETYLHITDIAMVNKPWRARYFIDLQAGPGKNDMAGEIRLGSPLIALTSPRPADEFRLNEMKAANADALEKRVATSPLADHVKIYRSDANVIVDEICRELRDVNSRQIPEKHSTFNIAFLDPEGLELKWATVEKLAQFYVMDLMINFSTGGLVRAIGGGNTNSVDEFFGSAGWRSVIAPSQSRAQRRAALIEFYLDRLRKFGYQVEIDPEFHHQQVIQVKNRKNVEVYCMIFASKHPLGADFWKKAAKITKPPRLPGF
ncbi:MAG: three-Cys-motif partner protein TcmP [Anaerolineae bacterium]|nr:three-Cys-motif partner protein TcmP [Anaerolineae bacterium]